MPWLTGAGLMVNVTFLPEWSPMPVHCTDRVNVCWQQSIRDALLFENQMVVNEKPPAPPNSKT
jgi:hypothetical protein